MYKTQIQLLIKYVNGFDELNDKEKIIIIKSALQYFKLCCSLKKSEKEFLQNK